jgi:hypothetical protein
MKRISQKNKNEKKCVTFQPPLGGPIVDDLECCWNELFIANASVGGWDRGASL